jgi:tetratricopeptide (TPR) repeat protein/transcriptional regulator with XRE-family HTH domain
MSVCLADDRSNLRLSVAWDVEGAMAGGSVQTQQVLQAAAAAHTVADIAGLLRELRRRHARQRRDTPLTYRELAGKTGWSQSAIGEYFSGQTLPPTDRLDALVALLGATPAEQAALGTARDRVEEHRRAAAPPGGAALPVARQLPRDASGFVGRDGELGRLDALLDQDGQGGRVPAVVISAVSGAAGVGKTALAVHWAHRIADRFPDGQLYINLRGFEPNSPPMAPPEAVRRFLDALGVPPQRIPVDPDSQAALYRSLLAGKRMLVVLDNARDASQVRPLLPGATHCLVLVTSRNQLAGLVAADGAHPLTLDLLTRAEAHDLLIRRLGADRVAAEPAAVDQIITACARLPLALAIVAARAATRPQLSLAALADELRDRRSRLDALTTGDLITDVRAAFSWSYHALTPGAARLFRLLGLHPGPDIAPAAAASLAGAPVGEVRPLLAELAAAHLVSEHSPGRFALHDLLRAYAAEQSQARDSDADRRAAVHRMLDHYLHTSHRAALLLNPQRQRIVLAGAAPGVTPEDLADRRHATTWFTGEHAVLLAAVDQSAAAGFDRHAWQLASTLWDYLEQRGHWRAWVSTHRTAADAAERGTDRTGLAYALRGLGGAYLWLGRPRDARAHLDRALAILREIGDLDGQAPTHHQLAISFEREGRHMDAVGHAERALDLYRATGHQSGQAKMLNGIGWHYALLGEYRQTLVYCGQAIAKLREAGDRYVEAATWDSLGFAHHHLGDHRQALRCYHQALDLIREVGDRSVEAAVLTHVGDTHHRSGDGDAAREAWQHALTILADLDHPDADQIRTKLASVDASPAGHGR